MKRYKFILLLILSLLISELSLWTIHWPGKLVMLILIPSVFSIYQFGNFIGDLELKTGRGHKNLAFHSLLIALLIANWVLKLHFSYYNIFLNIFFEVGF